MIAAELRPIPPESEVFVVFPVERAVRPADDDRERLAADVGLGGVHRFHDRLQRPSGPTAQRGAGARGGAGPVDVVGCAAC